MTVNGPTVVRRQLGARLRQLREAAGKRLTDVPKDIMSSTKLMKIEAGKVPVRLPDVWALCRFYEADSQTTDQLAALAKAAREEGWWEDYKDVVPEWLGLYVGLEQAAQTITSYHPELVLGLLQTPDYARAVLGANQNTDAEEVERRLKFRLERQTRVLDRKDPPPPRLKVILGAGALHLLVGSEDVMAAQRAHLAALARRPGIEVLILPWQAGAHAGLRGPFILLEFDDEFAPASAYAETHLGARYMERPSDVQEYRRIITLLEERTVPIKEYQV